MSPDRVQIAPLLTGRTGGDSRNRDMPERCPDRWAAGAGDSPGLAGLLAGIEVFLGTGPSGALPLSLAWASTGEDVEQVLHGVEAVTTAPRT
jgi:hypothetical protein